MQSNDSNFGNFGILLSHHFRKKILSCTGDWRPSRSGNSWYSFQNGTNKSCKTIWVRIQYVPKIVSEPISHLLDNIAEIVVDVEANCDYLVKWGRHWSTWTFLSTEISCMFDLSADATGNIVAPNQKSPRLFRNIWRNVSIVKILIPPGIEFDKEEYFKMMSPLYRSMGTSLYWLSCWSVSFYG